MIEIKNTTLRYNFRAFPTLADYGIMEPPSSSVLDLGLFTTRLARALMNTEGAEHIYAFVIGDGVPHVHVHVIGRYPGAPRQFWGPRVDEWPDAPHGAEREIAQVAARIRRFLQAEFR